MMNTPILDFIRRYAASDVSRLHMPGHKGAPFLGCEMLDITEIAGADSLYEADGVIAESERNAATLFGARRTFYSTEGSSHCIRAMVFLLAARAREARPGARPAILAARNAHKAFLYAAALADVDPVWLPCAGDGPLSCAVRPEDAARALDALDAPPAAVYVTSPDYLGGTAEIAALADVCHARGVPLAVDNAHGAYLHFLRPPRHPLDLGADICCDSAHKTLPALTGGAYLHIAPCAPEGLEDGARDALALFGSTSPSYLTLASLDRCNAYLADGYGERLAETCESVRALAEALRRRGWAIRGDGENGASGMSGDPLKLAIDAAESGVSGLALAERLRAGKVACEYASEDDLVLMFTPENAPRDYARVTRALGENAGKPRARLPLPKCAEAPAMRVREALLAPHESVPAREAVGRICAAPTVSCPPAVPIAVSGERITEETAALLERYGVKRVEVVKGGASDAPEQGKA